MLLVFNMLVLGPMLVFLTFDVVQVQALDNIALHKSANQAGAWLGLTADKAVDGKYYGTDDTFCAHPAAEADKPAQWWVDLEILFLVYNVTIYNTADIGGSGRLTNFEVSVGISLSAMQVCDKEYTSVVPSGGMVTIQCDLKGRFVRFQRTAGPEISYVTLCEVEVTGKTLIDCGNCAPGSQCTIVTGCSQCNPGKQLPDCTEDCTPGTYGLNCSNQCGSCTIVHNVNECSPLNGLCSSGCQSWWLGEMCKTHIVSPDWTSESSRINFDVTTNSSLTILYQEIIGLPSALSQYYKYEINYKTSGIEYQYAAAMKHRGDSIIHVVIGNLSYNTLYDIRVYPAREMPDIPFGPIKTYGTAYPVQSAKTNCGFPAKPSGVYLVADQTRSMFTVSWNSVTSLDSRCDSITKLWVDYRLPGQDWLQQAIPNITVTHLTVDPEYGGQYEVHVRVANNQNYESSSDGVKITIAGPSIPTREATTANTTMSPGGKPGSGPGNLIVIVVPVVVVAVVVIVIISVIVVFVIRKRKRGDNTEAQPKNSAYENQYITTEAVHSLSRPEEIPRQNYENVQLRAPRASEPYEMFQTNPPGQRQPHQHELYQNV